MAAPATSSHREFQFPADWESCDAKVTYKPKPRLLEVHPCRIPKGEKGYTGERCPEPKDAEIRVNGHLVDADVALAIPPEADTLDITVARAGYRTWSRTLSASSMIGSERIFVVLERAR